MNGDTPHGFLGSDQKPALTRWAFSHLFAKVWQTVCCFAQ